jgi:arginine utilization protein RocB
LQARIKQLARVHRKRNSQTLNVLDRQIPQPSFDGTDVRAIQRGSVGKLFLRDASRDTDQTDIRGEQVLQVERV